MAVPYTQIFQNVNSNLRLDHCDIIIVIIGGIIQGYGTLNNSEMIPIIAWLLVSQLSHSNLGIIFSIVMVLIIYMYHGYTLIIHIHFLY